MDIFQSWKFNFVFFVFITSLLLLYFFGTTLGINNAPEIILASFLTFIATIIGVSFPLYVKFSKEQTRKKEEMVFIANYVGTEILDNIIELDKQLLANKNAIRSMQGEFEKMPDPLRRAIIAAVWKPTSDELLVSLSDKEHQNMIMSGTIARINDESIRSGMLKTYQKMDQLKKELRRTSIILEMHLYPKPSTIKSANSYFQSQKLDKMIDDLELQIALFRKTSTQTVQAINILIKPYGREIISVKIGKGVFEGKTRKNKSTASKS